MLPCLVLAPGNEAIVAACRLELNAPPYHEMWRLVTAHFVHESWRHLLANALLLLVLHVLFGQYFTMAGTALRVVAIAPCISLGLYLNASFDYYLGSSALLYGLLTFGACRALDDGWRAGWLVLLALLLKLAAAHHFGPDPAMARFTGLPSADEAHLYGMLGGLMCWALRRTWTAWSPRWRRHGGAGRA